MLNEVKYILLWGIEWIACTLIFLYERREGSEAHNKRCINELFYRNPFISNRRRITYK